MKVKVAKTSEIQFGQSLVVMPNDVPVALFNVGGKFYAVDNTCPHQGGPLGEGSLDDAVVTCPWHAWQFDVTSGECVNAPHFKLKSYPVLVEGDDVYVEV